MIVAAGSQFEGYGVVIQGDNAGPHTNAEYVAFCNETCDEQGWHWELQAAQMLHMNNLLDLAVFPKMSKIHGSLLRLHSNTSVKPDAIWTVAQQTWSNLPSCDIARGFILAFCIANEEIKNKGSNSFLADKDFHQNVRDDFYDMAEGVKRRIEVL